MDKEICDKCPIYNDGLVQIGVRHTVNGAPRYVVNDGRKKVLCLAEAFGENEDLANQPLIGRAGKLLDKLLAESGLDRFSLKLDNVVKCRPIKQEGAKYKNRTPTPEEIEACKPYFFRDTITFEPDLIITLGRIPTISLFPDRDPSAIRGMAQELVVGEKKYVVLSTYHPSSCLYDPKNKPVLLKHLTNAANYLTELEDRDKLNAR